MFLKQIMGGLVTAAIAASLLMVGPGESAQAAAPASKGVKTIKTYSWTGYQLPKGKLPKPKLPRTPVGRLGKIKYIVDGKPTSRLALTTGVHTVRTYRTYRDRSTVTTSTTKKRKAWAERCTVTRVEADGPERATYWLACTDEDERPFLGEVRLGDRPGQYEVGEELPPYEVDGISGWVNVKVRHRETVYGSAKTAYSVKKRVRVVRIVNTPVMTKHEFKQLSKGMSISRVRAIVGDRGKLIGVDQLDHWSFTNSSGGFTWVAFDRHGLSWREWIGPYSDAPGLDCPCRSKPRFT